MNGKLAEKMDGAADRSETVFSSSFQLSMVEVAAVDCLRM